MQLQIPALIQIIVSCAVLASIPAGAWGYIFYKKQPSDRKYLLLTFAVGALAVFPILFYKWLWKYFPGINILEYVKNFESDLIGVSGFALIPLSVILTFMFVGVLEEVLKQSTVHAVDDNKINSIDDAIEFSIFAALGFAFTENILYFYTIWTKQGPDHLLVPFIFRSVFSTFAHILFSSLFGYFYGVAHFAKPLLQKELNNQQSRFWDWYYKVIHFKAVELFHEEKMLKGLTIAVGLHAVYNVCLEMNWTFIMVPYLVFGYLYVSHLLKLKENQKRLDLLFVAERNHNPTSDKIHKAIAKIVPST